MAEAAAPLGDGERSSALEKAKLREEIGLGSRMDWDGLSGGEMLDEATRVALTSRATTARRRRSAACRTEGRRGRAAAARGARDAGVGGKPGAGKAVSVGGATRRRPVAAPAAIGVFTARNIEEGEREMEVRAVL